jgi:hypothetical protein
MPTRPSIILEELHRQRTEGRKDLHVVTHDAKAMFTGTHNECFAYILNHQGQSVDYALKHGGWRIDPYAEGVFT